ncbi:MAG: hypothetical protein H6737_16295 [Alphaproteobacteria bacterium]|nr:hypothetical protein [Alphaproteobacteria bacterium]
MLPLVAALAAPAPAPAPRHPVFLFELSDSAAEAAAAQMPVLEELLDVSWEVVLPETPGCHTRAEAFAVQAAEEARVAHGLSLRTEQEKLVCGMAVRLDFDGAGHLVVTGEPWSTASLPAAPPDMWERLGAERVEGDWSEADRAQLWAVVSAIEPRVRALLRGAVWVASDRRRVRGAVASVTVRSRGDDLEILLSRGALTGEHWSRALVGDSTHSVGLLVHELGHVFALSPLRVWADRRRARRKDPTLPGCPRIRRARDLPVVAPFEALLAGRPSPTGYGTGDPHEVLAELYMLHVLHPDWLRREWPDVEAWFAGGGHVAWLDDPVWRACGADAFDSG